MKANPVEPDLVTAEPAPDLGEQLVCNRVISIHCVSLLPSRLRRLPPARSENVLKGVDYTKGRGRARRWRGSRPAVRGGTASVSAESSPARSARLMVCLVGLASDRFRCDH